MFRCRCIERLVIPQGRLHHTDLKFRCNMLSLGHGFKVLSGFFAPVCLKTISLETPVHLLGTRPVPQ